MKYDYWKSPIKTKKYGLYLSNSLKRGGWKSVKLLGKDKIGNYKLRFIR